MSARWVQPMALVGVIVLAVLYGGPGTVDRLWSDRLFGAEPGEAGTNCNTNGLHTKACPDRDNMHVCYTEYNVCQTPNRGVEQSKLCDPGNGDAACSVVDPDNCGRANEDILANQNCDAYTPG